MQRPTRILYLGTYEHDYPRNVLTIAALRQAGYAVEEVHASVWSSSGDKTLLLKSPLAMLRLGLRLVFAYISLAVRLIFDARRADLVVFGYIGQLDVLILGPLVRLLRLPIIFNPLITLTDTLIEDRKRIHARGILARCIRVVDQLSLRMAKIILVDTPENGEYLTATFNVPAERLITVPVGADEEMFRPLPSQSHSDAHAGTSVLFYGTMIPLQGVDTIIRAAKLLEDDGDTRFEIIGTGQMLESAQALARELSVSNVTFVPRVPYSELPRHIERADIVLGIFGTTAKAGRVIPNKVYQSMAMGAAIVTRDSIAQRRMLQNEESALLVPPGDPNALAAAIRRLYDPALRCRLGAAAQMRFAETGSLAVQSTALTDAVAAALSRSDRVCTGRVAV